MRCANSMPEIVIAALPSRLKLRITFVLDLMWRWSCSQVVQILRGPDLRVFRQQTIGLHLAHRAVRGSIAIERVGLRRLALIPDGLAGKGFGRDHIALCPEREVHRLASSIHRLVQVDTPATNFQVSLVDTPRATRRCSKAVPAFGEPGRITPHAAQARRIEAATNPIRLSSRRHR